MSEVSVLILCGRAPRHLYLANRLCRTSEVLAIVHERSTDLSLRALPPKLRPRHLARRLWRGLRDRIRFAGGGEARFFFGSSPPILDRADLVVEVPNINHADVVALADRLRPDVIAVFGTSLIKGPLLTRGRLGIVNLHGGLSPEYRGADCTFWTLYNNEPEKVGCTLHFIDAGIDTGRLIAHVRPRVTAGGSELTLFWAGVKASSEVYAEALDRLGRGEQLGVEQRDRSRLYQVKQRSWRHERELNARLRAGMLNDVDLPQRVTWYTASQPAQDAESQAPDLVNATTRCTSQ